MWGTEPFSTEQVLTRALYRPLQLSMNTSYETDQDSTVIRLSRKLVNDEGLVHFLDYG